ncbi:MAG: hypothetical protein ACK5JT_02770 [Hyphomicrobiaceae bacterium]
MRRPWQAGKLIAPALVLVALQILPASAQRIDPKIAAHLSAHQERAYRRYLGARAVFDRDLDAYWEVVEERRNHRRHLRAAKRSYSGSDFVQVQPPVYRGPSMPSDVARIIARLTPSKPSSSSSSLPDVSDFLANARRYYGFVPRMGSEDEFKHAYAREAVRLGLSKTQVVMVYALETGGRGTYDMQAGIDPITKKGRPISTALGYAQLLAANSINELVKHGPLFLARLDELSRSRGYSGSRREELKRKRVAVSRMLRVARSVRNAWSSHVALSRQPKGLGIHALNIDADIGPWLQTMKLKGVREVAEKAGRPHLSGAEIELMNLAGPRTGLEMMDRTGLRMPTANFFSRRAYYRNTIVRDKSSAALLHALDQRMQENLKQQGSISFAQAFDTVLGRRGPTRAARR